MSGNLSFELAAEHVREAIHRELILDDHVLTVHVREMFDCDCIPTRLGCNGRMWCLVSVSTVGRLTALYERSIVHVDVDAKAR